MLKCLQAQLKLYSKRWSAVSSRWTFPCSQDHTLSRKKSRRAAKGNGAKFCLYRSMCLLTSKKKKFRWNNYCQHMCQLQALNSCFGTLPDASDVFIISKHMKMKKNNNNNQCYTVKQTVSYLNNSDKLSSAQQHHNNVKFLSLLLQLYMFCSWVKLERTRGTFIV